MDKQTAYEQLKEFDRAHSQDGPGIWVPACGGVVFPDGAIRSTTDKGGLAGWNAPQPCADLHQRATLILAYWDETVARGIASFEALRSGLRGQGHLSPEFASPAVAERELRRLLEQVRTHQAKAVTARAEVERCKPALIRTAEARDLADRTHRQALYDLAQSIKI